MKEILKARITQASDSEELIDLAKERGIILPSDNLGAFKTVYARLEDSNRNGVRLATDAVEKALQSLIGAQVNINHWRENWTVGSIFWAKINDNDAIEVAFTFFKDVYPDEYELAMELFEKGELTVSFELTADKDKQEFHADGTRTLHDVHFVGCGLLLNENPAEPTAIVFESAKRQIEELVTRSTGNLVFAKDNEINFDRLREAIKATLNPDTIEVLDKESQINPVTQGGSKLMDKTKKEVTPVKAEEVIKPEAEETSEVESTEVSEEEKVDKISEDKPKEEVEDKPEKEVVEEAPAEEVVEEKKVDEEKAEDISEEAEAESDKAKVEYKTEIKKEVTETYDEDETKVEVDSEVTETVEVDGEPSSKVVNKTKSETVYTYAEVEEIKAELNAEIALLQEALETKDSEIESAKETAVTITKLKIELGEYVVDFKEEDFLNADKVENARLRKENDALKDAPVVEEAKIKEEKKEVIEASSEEKVDLDTGHEEVVTASESKSALRDTIRDSMKTTREV